jgi:hypothetical protein
MPTPVVTDPDPFDVLGVPESASDKAIDAAWKRLIRKCHPDYATDDADRKRRLAKSVRLNLAHDALLDPGLKAEALLERRRRSATYAQPIYASPQSPPTRSPAGDTWAGSTWSTTGGRREPRRTWFGTYPADPPPGGAQPEASEGSTRRIVLVTLEVLATSAYALIRSGGLAALAFAMVVAAVVIRELRPWGGAALTLLVLASGAYVFLNLGDNEPPVDL